MRKVAPLSPLETWFVGDVNVGEANMKNHTDSVQEYEDAVERENVACLRSPTGTRSRTDLVGRSVRRFCPSRRRDGVKDTVCSEGAVNQRPNGQTIPRGEMVY